MKSKRIKIFVIFPLSLIICWIAIHLIVTVIDGIEDQQESADIAVIFGNKVNEDGTLSNRLIQRLQIGLFLYQSKRIQKILITGGLGQEGFYEGDKMRDFLWQNGVPLSDLIVDNMGSNTLLSVKNTLKLKASLKFQSIIVVSQYYHILRIKLLFRQLGFNRVSSVSPYYFEARDIYSLLREFLAYYRHRFSPPVK